MAFFLSQECEVHLSLSKWVAIFHPCQCTSLSLPPITLPFHPVLSRNLFTIYLPKLMNVEFSPSLNALQFFIHVNALPYHSLLLPYLFIQFYPLLYLPIYLLKLMNVEFSPSLNALQFFIHVNMHFIITPSYCITISSSFISCFIYHLSSFFSPEILSN
jgi:hypothetical protein